MLKLIFQIGENGTLTLGARYTDEEKPSIFRDRELGWDGGRRYSAGAERARDHPAHCLRAQIH